MTSSLFHSRYCLTLLERQCCGALSRNKIILRNFLFSSPRYKMKEYWLNVSYCLNNCLPSKVIVPNTRFLMRASRYCYWTFPFGVHILLLINASYRNTDSSSIMIVNPLGMFKIISSTFF